MSGSGEGVAGCAVDAGWEVSATTGADPCCPVGADPFVPAEGAGEFAGGGWTVEESAQAAKGVKKDSTSDARTEKDLPAFREAGLCFMEERPAFLLEVKYGTPSRCPARRRKKVCDIFARSCRTLTSGVSFV